MARQPPQALLCYRSGVCSPIRGEQLSLAAIAVLEVQGPWQYQRNCSDAFPGSSAVIRLCRLHTLAPPRAWPGKGLSADLFWSLFLFSPGRSVREQLQHRCHSPDLPT